MRYISNFLLSGLLILMSALLISAQTENDLKNYFEGRRVEIRLDMPATKDGVNVYPEKDRAIDFSRYGDLMKNFGASLLEGDRVMITKVKVKSKHIEFQLGGGGYGTFGDDSGAVSVPMTSKSNREKDLEKSLKYEENDRERRHIRRELDYLRNEREREDNSNRAAAATAQQIAKVRIQEKRLQAGSRFNIKFDRKLNAQDLTPQAIMDALSQYVSFADSETDSRSDSFSDSH